MNRTTHPTRGVDHSALQPELRVLMETVRPDGAALGKALEGRFSWELLLLLAEEEKAIPVLHRSLEEALAGRPPPPEGAEALAVLERLAWVHRLRLMELERRLQALVEIYRNEGIQGVLLKGAALRMCVYGSLLERPMGDIDLVVRPHQVEAAWEVARGLGWRPAEGDGAHARYRYHHHAPPLEDDRGLGLELEIHTRLFRPGNPFPFSAASLMAEARESEHEPRALIPSPEHLLLHIALHFTWSHRLRFGAWRTFRDVDALMARGDLDWDRFIHLARANRAGTGAFWTLHLARTWGGVPVEDRVLQELGGPGPGLVRRRLERHFAFQILPPPGSAAPGMVNRLAWEVAMRPRRQGHGRSRPWSRDPEPSGAVGREIPAREPVASREAGDPMERPSFAVKGVRAMRHLAHLV